MNCQDYEIELGDYVDGTRGARTHDAFSAHLSTCPRCQALVADLTALRQATRSLEPQLPSPQVWTKLSAALEAERGGGLRLWGFTWQTLAASVVTLTLVAGLAWTGSHLARSMPAPVETASSGGAEFGDAEAEFTTAIAGLESITKAEQSTLDMDTADVVQANLTVIDGAISESRAALQTEPDSQAAQQSLFEALRSKVELLQDIVALINEMRKGNPEGAARIVSGLNQ